MSAFRSGAVDPRRNEVVYKDLGLSFVAHPVTKNVSVINNLNFIYNIYIEEYN